VIRREEVCLPLPDATLFALDQGGGPPLLFFHGGLADHRAALLLVGALADRLRVITPDLRGSGRSHWSGPLSWQQHAADAVAWLDRLGLDRATVGGVSMGSAVALRTALSHPDRVSGLILVHPVFAGTERGIDDAPRAAMEAMDGFGRRVPTEGPSALYPLFDALPDEIRPRARAMVDGFDPGSVASTTAFLASCVQPFDTASELAAVRCPGTDPTHPAEVATWLASRLPGAVLCKDADRELFLQATEGP
jgi:pimeloyl-ACP methyl ester carboxylesterase